MSITVASAISRRTLTLAIALVLAPLAALLAAEPVSIDLAKRTWQGIPGLERTTNGRVFVSWFTGGTKEPEPENTVVLSHSDDGGKTFSAPQAMALPLSDGTRCYDPCLWIDPKGRLWYLFNRGNKDTAKHDVVARICDEPDAQTPVFGAEFRVGFEGPYAFRMNKPTVLSTGEWIMPVTHATETIKEWFAGPKQLQGVGISTDEGKTWKLHGALKAPEWALECMITELKDGRLWLLTRTGGGFLWESQSTDKGRTWSEAKASSIANPGSRFFIRRLASGHLLLVNHHKFTGRSHLTAQLSTDDGATWNDGLLLDERKGVSYPDGVQDKDGLIWITYDRDRGGAGEILLAKFKEEDVVAGKNVSGAVSLKQVVNKLDKPSLLSAGWNAKAAADKVLAGLIRVSAPQVKGAHDAEFVCVDDRAYIVEHDNDVAPGHGAGAAQYCVLSIVNLRTLAVEKTLPMAKSEQAFDNVTLPKGMCFVPRIIRKDEHTLRTYFCSQPDREQAITFYRDFDLRTLIFEESIHRAKLKTAAGTFDMEPRHFHADAAAQGFTRPAVNHGLYIFDSFKEFDGRRYVALNNFPGKQNALAVLHDDFVTFEVIGHYNDPQSQQLSESAVNRLPDGTWSAIVRNDAGNYHFTTSKDGRTWTTATQRPFVPNGLNSKPTFDRFGGIYYLGWQENTKVGDCGRSVFNVDISRDGRSWERKYRFESPHSFQYPTFHEHDGTIWLTVTQSDHKGSSDRIMFGRLEELPKPKPAVKVTQELLNSIHVTPKLIVDPMPAYGQKYLLFAMAASMESTKKGRLWTCWAGGQDGPNAYLLASYSDDQGKSWRDPVFVIDPQAHGLKMGTRLGSFWCDPKGRLWLFFHQSVGMFDGSCSNWFVRCDDPDADKPAWTEPVYIGFGASLNKPIVRRNGEWILPVSLWERWHIDKPFADCYRELDAVRGANVFVSNDEGGHWRYRGGIIFKDSCFNEHTVVELQDGRLWMLSRGMKESVQSFSADGGKTWQPQSRAFPHTNSKAVIRRLQSGNIILIRHGQDITQATPDRRELTAFLTVDEGQTWSGKLLLDERANVSYPDIAQAPGGDIYIHYDRERGGAAEINFARFREEDVLAGRLVSKVAALKNIVKSRQFGMNRGGAVATTSTKEPQAASWPLDAVADTLVVRGNAQTAAGVAGKSLVLNGESLIELKDSEKFASGEFTVSLWFNPYDLAGGQQMLAGKTRYSRNERQWSLTIEPDGKLKAHLRQNGWSTILCTAPLVAGRWHLATLVADARKALLYLNGKLVGEVKLASPVTATAAPITLGGIWDAGAVRQAFHGAVDEFSFQPRALSATEIATSYQPVSVTHDVPKLAAGLPLWDATQTLPKAADLPQVAGAKFYVLKRQRPDEDGCNFTLGVGLIRHKGKLYASYGFNEGNENTITEEAHVRVSEDGGQTWGKPVVMDAGEGNLGVSHGVFLSHGGKLWAFMGAFYDNFQRTHARAYWLNETSGRWEPQGVVLDQGFWPMQEPQRMADGNWIMAGFRVVNGFGLAGNLPAVAISQGDDFTKWKMVVIQADKSLGTNLWGESTVIVEKQRITNIARYGAKALALVSTSEDHGRTWTPATASNLPMATSKPYAGTLSNGQRYLVCTTTANTGGGRSPLTIAVSKPGESVFSKVFLIRTSEFEGTSGVSRPNIDFSYPYAVEHEGQFYIGYTHKSHAANELAVIPVSSLEITP